MLTCFFEWFFFSTKTFFIPKHKLDEFTLQVNKHGTFQESRCLYVVSTDGRKEDFSYRKCLENLVKSKFPDVAAEFLGKYFRKPRPREPNSTPERNSTPEQNSTPVPSETDKATQ